MSFDLKISAGDLVLKNGQLDVVTGQQKLIQDILKICLTKAGTNIYQPWYGSFLSKSVIGSGLDASIMFDVARSQLQTAIENLKKVQELQSSSGQKMTPDEQISYISDISINRNQIDPRLIEVYVSVLTRAFTRANASFQINNLT